MANRHHQTIPHSTHQSLRALALGVLASGLFLVSGVSAAATPTVIELTQTGCQFVEAEGVDHGFKTSRKADCEAVNQKNGDARLGKSKTLELKPGKYVFRVTNENVPYALGFWLRGDGLLNRAKLPSTSGGGLTLGKSKDYEIELVAGEYVYSCPLNPTPDYKLIVK
ncbi:MAG: hypothetical protein AAF493_06580 [Pseudomonadota bacterium]